MHGKEGAVNVPLLKKFIENFIRVLINHMLMLIVTWQLFTIDKDGTETTFT